MNDGSSQARLGVVIPTRNAAATLGWTLRSLSSQERAMVDVVVVDSDSTDATIAICDEWHLARLRVPPGNMYTAVNAGMRALATPWLTYLNGDDLVYADGYARLLARGESRTLDVVYGDADFIDGTGRLLYSQAALGPRLARALLASGRMPFAQPAAVFRREVFERLHGFDDRFRHIADYDFYARAAAAGFRLGKVPAPPVAAFRILATQLSTVQEGLVDEEKRRRRRQCGRIRYPARVGLSAIWKARNAANTLAWIARSWRRRASRLAGRGPAANA
jgi:glycosyltransferase involved in cell wall biosynthesis